MSTDGWDCKLCADGANIDSCRCEESETITGGLELFSSYWISVQLRMVMERKKKVCLSDITSQPAAETINMYEFGQIGAQWTILNEVKDGF